MVYFSKDYCSPLTVKDFEESGSCYSLESLKKIARKYNKEYPDNKIRLSVNKRELILQIKERLSGICNDEMCWKASLKVNDPYIQDYTFKPHAPKSKWAWLSTLNINHVLFQYSKALPEFLFLGTFAADKHPKITLSTWEHRPKLRYIGTVFNTDTSNGTGEHWVALLIDTKDKTIEFFDSDGSPPQKEFRNFINKIKTKNAGQRYRVVINHKRHQYTKSECGMYAIWYLLARVSGKSVKDINKKRVTDSQINKLRDVFFLPRN